MSGEELELWEAYRGPHTPQSKEAARERLLQRHLPLVRMVLGRLAFRFPSATAESSDFYQAGAIGLIQAVERFEPAYGVEFSSFASRRIRGQILDELRALDWVPRSVREKGVKTYSLHSLEHLMELKEEGEGSSLIDSAPHHEALQSEDMEKLQTAALLRQGLDRALKPVQREVLHLYYFQDLTLKQIAVQLGLTESRICQIHAASIKRLREQGMALAA
jgi:RNA polymerase sigma factor for flagellar operon FliA